MLRTLKDSFQELRTTSIAKAKKDTRTFRCFSYFSFLHICRFSVFIVHLKHRMKGRCNKMKKYIKQNGITYELRGEQYYPLLELPEQKEIGKYGRMHLEYLKEHRKGRYTNLLSEGTLNQRLYEIDLEAKTMVESIISRLATERGIDENLKIRDMLRWVAEMNNIKVSAEEIVLWEVVYV